MHFFFLGLFALVQKKIDKFFKRKKKKSKRFVSKEGKKKFGKVLGVERKKSWEHFLKEKLKRKNKFRIKKKWKEKENENWRSFKTKFGKRKIVKWSLPTEK